MAAHQPKRLPRARHLEMFPEIRNREKDHGADRDNRKRSEAAEGNRVESSLLLFIQTTGRTGRDGRSLKGPLRLFLLLPTGCTHRVVATGGHLDIATV